MKHFKNDKRRFGAAIHVRKLTSIPFGNNHQCLLKGYQKLISLPCCTSLLKNFPVGASARLGKLNERLAHGFARREVFKTNTILVSPAKGKAKI